MKKVYSEIELEVLLLTEDIVSTSGGTTYGNQADLNNPNMDAWDW